MTLHTRDWESPLLAMAYEATRTHSQNTVFNCRDELLEQAYAHCEAMTSWHSKSFSLASRLLPLDQRRAVRALYAFCRTTDDLVDHPSDNASEALAAWRHASLTWEPPQEDLVAVAWADARARFNIPQRCAEQLIDGVARDLHQSRYETFKELTNYCYGVASTVGLMSMYIIGFYTQDAISYAVKLGVALQMTNILRDIAEDWQRGRLYLPQEELETFGLSEADIERGIVTDRWRNFMRFQIDRNRRLYLESRPGIAMLAPEGRLSIVAATDFYRAILEDIEAHDYDVFSRRSHLTGWEKIRRLPALWWHTRQLQWDPVQ